MFFTLIHGIIFCDFNEVIFLALLNLALFYIVVILGCVEVKSVDHKDGVVGRYFNFLQSDVNAVLGSYGHGSIHSIDQYRDGTKIVDDGQVKLWTTVNGGTIGDGHGRYNPISNALAGQWKIGDRFCFKPGI